MEENETRKPEAAEVEKTKETRRERKERKRQEKRKLPLKKRIIMEVREWVVSLVAAAAVVYITSTFIFLPIRVDGDSMNPTLVNDQRLIVTAYDVRLVNKIERGDVVICHYPGRTSKDSIVHLVTVKTNFVKRVVGIPGDTVSRVKNVTYVNGEPLDPRKFNPYTSNPDYEYVLGEEEYFVVGDNRYNSHDSRAWNGPEYELRIVNDVTGDVGPITKDCIVGRARLVFWPLDEISAIETNPDYAYPGD